MQVADDGVDLYDDVLGDAGLYGSAIDHLSEVDALLVWLSDRYLTEYFILAGNNDCQLLCQKSANCCAKNQPIVASKNSQLLRQKSANCRVKIRPTGTFIAKK